MTPLESVSDLTKDPTLKQTFETRITLAIVVDASSTPMSKTVGFGALCVVVQGRVSLLWGGGE